MLISLSVDNILLPRYVNWSTNFRGQNRNGSFLFKTHEFCFICIVVGYEVRIQIAQMYLGEALNYFCRLFSAYLLLM